jgi:phosphotransferase system IIA component
MSHPEGFDFHIALDDKVGIERAFIAAARDAIRQHRAYSLPIVVWQDDQVKQISVDEYERNINERESKLNAKVEGQTL